MRILKVGFNVQKGESFRIGWYIGKVLFRLGDYILVKDMNDGANKMSFKFYENLK